MIWVLSNGFDLNSLLHSTQSALQMSLLVESTITQRWWQGIFVATAALEQTDRGVAAIPCNTANLTITKHTVT